MKTGVLIGFCLEKPSVLTHWHREPGVMPGTLKIKFLEFSSHFLSSKINTDILPKI